MPHVLWEWQGSRGADIEEIKAVKDEKSGEGHRFVKTIVTFDNAGNRMEKTEKIEGGHPHEGIKLTLTPGDGRQHEPGRL